jgi:DNA-binding CsgD family transcriptional regulator
MPIVTAWEEFKRYRNASSAQDHSSFHVERIMQEHPFFLKALSLSKVGFCVIDIKQMQYLHVSSNVYEITGWPYEKYMAGGVEFGFSAIVPEAQHGVVHFSQLMSDYFKNLPNTEKPNYSAYFDYKINGPTGIKRLLQQDYALSYDAEGFITILLAVCVDIKNIKSDKSMHLRLTNDKENTLYEFEVETKKLTEVEPLSKRELEIARMINQGNDSAHVASILNISPHTVTTHRRNMLEKLHVDDTLEMSNLLRVLGFL